jgi:hypothetical protein
MSRSWSSRASSLLALDVERPLLRFEVARPDLDHRILLDVVAQLAPVLDVADQRGQALRVEAVGRIEEFEAGLVDVEDREAFQLEPVLLEVGLRHRLHPRNVVGALLVHPGHVHLGRDGAQRALELARQQGVSCSGSSVRRPRVEAAMATARRSGCTRT